MEPMASCSNKFSHARALRARCLLGLSALVAATGLAAPASSQAAPSCFGMRATIVGTPGDDHIVGKKAPDVIVGLGGNDTIDGFKGNDRICGGPGDDYIVGFRGVDHISGDDGNDTIDG